jgi:YfiH family protein
VNAAAVRLADPAPRQDPAHALPLVGPRWAAPPAVGAAMSQRRGGASSGSWASLNLGVACGDAPAAVAENRRRFAAALGVQAVWLRQVHGTQVVRLTAAHRQEGAATALPAADAAWTTEPGMACTVLVADCLPVLLAARDGRAVAAAHAGWRGLAAGVLEATVAALRDEGGCAPADLVAWIGPGIGPRRFEVGADVLQAFGVDPSAVASSVPPSRRRSPAPSPAAAFSPRGGAPAADGRPRWLADLPALAALRLAAAGVGDIGVDGRCTAGRPSAFFSHRRDGVTGRMAAAVWRRG